MGVVIRIALGIHHRARSVHVAVHLQVPLNRGLSGIYGHGRRADGNRLASLYTQRALAFNGYAPTHSTVNWCVRRS